MTITVARVISHYKLVLILLLSVLASPVFGQRTDFWNINFNAADSIAELHREQKLKDPYKLAEHLTKDLTTDVEKFRAIFRWITYSIRYDYDLYLKNELKSRKLAYNRSELAQWKKKFIKKTYARTLRRNLAVCSGYSMLLEHMSNHVGIQCTTIAGYGRNQDSSIGSGKINHAWNAVLLDNRWYLCDPTWASGYVDDATQRYYRKFNKNYFLPDPTLFIANHFPADTTWTLLKQQPTLQQFLKAPIKENGYIVNKINSYSPSDGIIKCKAEQKIDFKFTSNITEVGENVTLIVERTGSTSKSFLIPLKRNKEGEFILEYCFEQKGKFTVGIYINSELTFIYKVNVS